MKKQAFILPYFPQKVYCNMSQKPHQRFPQKKKLFEYAIISYFLCQFNSNLPVSWYRVMLLTSFVEKLHRLRPVLLVACKTVYENHIYAFQIRKLLQISTNLFASIQRSFPQKVIEGIPRKIFYFQIFDFF